MFTGIVEELGTVVRLDGSRLSVRCGAVAVDAEVGASIAVNGTCLTVVATTPEDLSFDLSEETLARPENLPEL